LNIRLKPTYQEAVVAMTITGRGIATSGSLSLLRFPPVAPFVPSAPSWGGIQEIKKKADKEP